MAATATTALPTSPNSATLRSVPMLAAATNAISGGAQHAAQAAAPTPSIPGPCLVVRSDISERPPSW